MSRDVRKSIEEYRRRFWNGKEGDRFFCSDYEQIREIAGSDPFDLVNASCSFAFMVGYRYRKKEERARRESGRRLTGGVA